MRGRINEISQSRVREMAFLAEGTARAKALRARMWARASNDECGEDTDLKWQLRQESLAQARMGSRGKQAKKFRLNS